MFESRGSDILIQKLALLISSRHITLPSLDNLNHINNCILENDFKSILFDLPMTFNSSDLAIILDHYRVKSSTQFSFVHKNYINYQLFLEDISQKNDSNSKPSPTKQNKEYDPLFKDFSQYIHHGGSDLFDIMKSFDRLRIGKVSTNNFCSALPDYPKIHEFSLLVEDPQTRMVDYRKLQSIIDEIPVESYHIPSYNISPEAALELVRIMHSKNIQLDIAFRGVRRTEKGMMYLEKFVYVLQQLRLRIPADIFDKAIEFFTKGSIVDFPRFQQFYEEHSEVKQVQQQENDQIFKENYIEKLILELKEKRIPIWQQFVRRDTEGTGKVFESLFIDAMKRLNIKLSDNEIKKAAESLTVNNSIDYINLAESVYPYNPESDTLQKLKEFAKLNAISISSLLKQYDYSKTGKMPETKFLIALWKNGIELTDQDLTNLRKDNEIDKEKHILKYVNILSQYEHEAPVRPLPIHESTNLDELWSSSPQKTPMKLPKPQCNSNSDKQSIPDQLIPLFGKIKAAIDEYRFDLNSEFYYRDKEKKGIISPIIFKQIIELLPLRLLPSETEALVTFYLNPNLDKCIYSDFCNDINEFGDLSPPQKSQKKIGEEEKEPKHTLNTRMQQKVSISPLARSALKKLNAYVFSHSVPIMTMFKPLDHLNNGTILLSQLDQAFSSTGIQFSQKERDELAKTFTVTETPERFNYFLLIKEIENPENRMDDGGRIPMAFGDEEKCKLVIHRLVDTLRVRRFTFKKLFSNVYSDYLSSQQFRQILDSTGLCISTADEKLIFQKYKINNRGDIDYKAFVEDTENFKSIL